MKFASRPKFISESPGSARPSEVASNHFKFEQRPDIEVTSYAVNITPETSGMAQKKKIMGAARTGLTSQVGTFQFFGATMVGLKKTDGGSVKATVDGREQTISFQLHAASDKDKESFQNNFFNNLQKKLKLQQFGRKFFDAATARDVAGHDIAVWNGYSTSIAERHGGPMAQVDVSHRTVRKSSCLQTLYSIREKIEKQRSFGKQLDLQTEVKKALQNSYVITSYNQRPQQVNDVDFSMTPLSTFEANIGGAKKTISFKDQQQTTHNLTISDVNQPMLISRRERGRGGESESIALVPELCMQTGMSDDMRADFRLMMELGKLIKPSPGERLNRCGQLIDRINNDTNCNAVVNEYGIRIQNIPAKQSGAQLSAGKIVFGGGKVHDLAAKSMFDREAQGKMLSMPAVGRWAVLYLKQDEDVKNSVMKEIQAAKGRSEWTGLSEPLVGDIANNTPAEWTAAIQKVAAADFILLLLPGAKGKDEKNLQNICKRLTIKDLGIPTQVLLTGTVRKGKGLTSVVSKVLSQICAKLPTGAPWGLESPEGFTEPTMVCGLDVYHGGSGKKSVLGFTASLDMNVSRHWSNTAIQESAEELTAQVRECMGGAIGAFARANGGVKPKKIIVYRDGVSEGQLKALLEGEVRETQSALDSDMKLIQIVVNKRIDAKFYAPKGSNQEGCNEGVCIDNTVTKKGMQDFFMMPLKARQGTANPVQYTVLSDTSAEKGGLLEPWQLQTLTYRLCYMYQNWSGPVRVPSEVMLAHKLAYLIGERAEKDIDPPKPHGRFAENPSH